MSHRSRGMIHSTVSIIDAAAIAALQQGGSIQDHIQKAYFTWVEAHTPTGLTETQQETIRNNLHFLGFVAKE